MQQYIEGFSLFVRPPVVEKKGARTIAMIELNGKGLNQASDAAANDDMKWEWEIVRLRLR
jgi:hypothetical protein